MIKTMVLSTSCLIVLGACGSSTETSDDFVRRVDSIPMGERRDVRVRRNAAGDVVSLNLARIRLSEKDWNNLAALSSLEHINLMDTGFTDSDVAWLLCLPQLKIVTVSGRLSDKGLAQLATIPRLEALTIHNAQITGNCLAALRKAERLQFLLLYELELTDRDIDHLIAIPNLWYVGWAGNKVTSGGLDRLRRAKPDLDVDINVDEPR